MSRSLARKLLGMMGMDRSGSISVPKKPMMEPQGLRLDFQAQMGAAFPESFNAAWQATNQILDSIRDADLRGLERHSPSLKGFDWHNYLKLSVLRILSAHAALRRLGFCAGELLDLGSYFGNFSLFFAHQGFRVDAVDSYRAYGPAMEKVTALLFSRGVTVLDFETLGRDLNAVKSATYDVVLCMGVIEHLPDTPRMLLETLDRVLKPGGLLVLDTPNLAYLYNRRKLLVGESIFCPIQFQYYTEIPFQGHHREYTVDEVLWMLGELKQQVLHCETFNYSLYGLECLTGQDLENYRTMLEDPSAREIILTVSQKGGSRSTRAAHA